MRELRVLLLLLAASHAAADDGVELTPNAEIQLSRFSPTIAITANGSHVAMVVGKSDVALFDAATGKQLQRWQLGAESVQFVSDGHLWVTTRHKLHVLSVDGGDETLWNAEGGALATNDGAWVASIDSGVLTIRATRGKPQVLMRKLRAIQTMVFSGDGGRFCVVTNESTDDTPSGNTTLTIFDRKGRHWKRVAKHIVEGSRQENDAAFVSRDQLLLDDNLIDLRTGRTTPTNTPWLSAVSSDGQAVLFLDHSGKRQQWARVSDGKLGPLLDANRPRQVVDRGHAMAVSSRGHVVWCLSKQCVIGPAATN